MPREKCEHASYRSRFGLDKKASLPVDHVCLGSTTASADDWTSGCHRFQTNQSESLLVRRYHENVQRTEPCSETWAVERTTEMDSVAERRGTARRAGCVLIDRSRQIELCVDAM